MASALIVSLAMVLITGAIGMYIRNKIWGVANKPTNPIEYGRAWAAYLAFIVPISSIHRFIKKGWVEGFISLMAMLIVFCCIAFISGYIYGHIKNRYLLNNAPRNDLESDKAYEQALNEITSNDLHVASWAKALALSNGDELKAKSIYIQLRASRILNTTPKESPYPKKKWTPQIPSFVEERGIELIVVLVFTSLVVFALNVFSIKDSDWRILYEFENGITTYVDLTSIKKTSNGFYEVTTGDNTSTTSKSKLNKSYTDKFTFNCQKKEWRLTERVEYETPIQAKMGKILTKTIYKESLFSDIDKNETGWDTYNHMEDIALNGYPHLEKLGILTPQQARRAKEYPQSMVNLFNMVCK